MRGRVAAKCSRRPYGVADCPDQGGPSGFLSHGWRQTSLTYLLRLTSGCSDTADVQVSHRQVESPAPLPLRPCSLLPSEVLPGGAQGRARTSPSNTCTHTYSHTRTRAHSESTHTINNQPQSRAGPRVGGRRGVAGRGRCAEERASGGSPEGAPVWGRSPGSS